MKVKKGLRVKPIMLNLKLSKIFMGFPNGLNGVSALSGVKIVENCEVKQITWGLLNI